MVKGAFSHFKLTRTSSLGKLIYYLITTIFQDYLRNREGKPRKKLILPPVIPWEYGSNKFASQKGTGGFGSPRNATVTIKSSKELSKSNDGVVPRLACPPLWDKELASQSGQTPFGKFREHVFKTQDIDSEVRQDINMLSYFKSESILKLWSRPNPDAKINKPFGHKRNEITESVGGRQFSAKELQASRAAIPRFQDPRNTIAAKAKKEQKKKDSFGNLIIPEPFAHLALQQPRIYKTLDSTSDGISMDLLSLNDEEGNQITAEQYMAWLGGQLTIQSTRGAEKQQRKSRNYASFYERLMSERTPTKREIREKLKKLQMEAKNNASAAKVSKADEDAQQMSSKYEQQDSHENESNNDQITKVLESNEKQSIKSESEINSSQKPHLTVTTTTTESNHTTMKQKANVPESLASDLSSNVANSVEYDSKNVNTYTNGIVLIARGNKRRVSYFA
uniref:Uncharacterized protein n=1 Tax=Syphacia muris TaxID=451379 RepID=A0A0N5AYH4_9BILA